MVHLRGICSCREQVQPADGCVFAAAADDVATQDPCSQNPAAVSAPQLYHKASTAFRKRLLRGLTPGLQAALLAAAPDQAAVQDLLFPYFAEFVLAEFPNEVAAYRCVY